jgi:hypothetical protein
MIGSKEHLQAEQKKKRRSINANAEEPELCCPLQQEMNDFKAIDTAVCYGTNIQSVMYKTNVHSNMIQTVVYITPTYSCVMSRVSTEA